MQEDRIATVVHTMPGRLRVRLSRSLGTPETLGSVAESLSQVPGVRHVQVNPVSRSVLLLYDPQLLSLEDLSLAAAAADIRVTVPGENGGGHSSEELSGVARSINNTFGSMDESVRQATAGRLDAKTLLPLALGAAGLRQIFASGAAMRAIPGYVLLWYAFEMFTKYNLRRGSTQTK
jgi:hypothetical protein